LIEFARENHFLSPFFVISLIWYPCFELLFSIIRRLIVKKRAYMPDTKHLHQILFQFFFKKNNNVELSHFYVSLMINGYCSISLALNYTAGYKTSVILFFLLLNIFVYLILYKKLTKRVF